MKAKVLIEFTDKLTRKRHYVGSVYEGSTERVKLLSERGILAPVKEEIKEEVKAITKPKKNGKG